MADVVPPTSSLLSQPPSSLPQQLSGSSQQANLHKSARELPFELQQYVRIYLEESLFTRAFDLLLSIVSSDASGQRNEITVPHPDHLALTATLVVHPLVTTRTTSEDKWAEANAALRLLRLLLRTAGPVNSRFADAFKFRKLYNVSNDDNDDDDEPGIKHSFANEDSLWNRAEDFWAVVGWTFNCSCLPDMYTARWEHWQLWLGFMIEFLEADWKQHLLSDTSAQSMLWKYMSHTPGDVSLPRRVVRAIFADGSKASLNEFREIFKRELKGPKQEVDKVKNREAVDIDNEIYGDYLAQDDSDETSDNEARTSQRTSTRTALPRRVIPRTSRQSLHSDFEEDAAPTSISGLGPPESIALRLRLMQLLVHISTHPELPQSRTINFPDPTDLFTLFVAFIKPLPLGTFQQFISPSICSSTAIFSPDVLTTLLEFLLQRILENAIQVIPAVQPLTQPRFETEYLPFAASKSSIDANARASLCIESLLRSLVNEGSLTKIESLERALEKGIERRMAKVKVKREKAKEGSEEEEALEWLLESSARMRGIMKRLKP